MSMTTFADFAPADVTTTCPMRGRGSNLIRRLRAAPAFVCLVIAGQAQAQVTVSESVRMG